ncbi:MAG TPA: methyltransferase domain-containing protein [Chitinophagaceae bacterium]
MKNKTISLVDPIGSGTLQLIAKATLFNKWMYSEFKSELKGEILEVGSGIGNISQLAVDDGLAITLSDYNAEYCDWLRKKFEGTANVNDILQIDLLRPDFKIAYFPLKEKFESIFLLNVLEHISDDHAALSNCHFMIKPGGSLIVLVPAYKWLYSPLDKELGHYRRYDSKAVKKILEEELFTIKKITHFNFLGIGGWLLSGKIFREKKLGANKMGVFNRIVPIAKLLDKITFKKFGLSVIAVAKKKNNW